VIAAVVPVKALAASKSRLFPDLERGAIERLSLAMMGDVVEALSRVRGIARVVVVTPDAEVAAAAEAAGATGLLRPDPGLNEAIEAAAAEVTAASGDGVLVVLGDVPGLVASEVETLIAALDGPGVALAPSNDGGTSALLRVPRDAIPARFGPDSAKRHREAAERAGVAYREVPLPSLAIDVDVREDVEALLRSDTVGRRTRAVLEALGAEVA
jgi:2-phospho-L-lactate guanylyltransferase